LKLTTVGLLEGIYVVDDHSQVIIIRQLAHHSPTQAIFPDNKKIYIREVTLYGVRWRKCPQQVGLCDHGKLPCWVHTYPRLVYSQVIEVNSSATR